MTCGGPSVVKAPEGHLCRYCHMMLDRVGHESWLAFEDAEAVKQWKDRLERMQDGKANNG